MKGYLFLRNYSSYEKGKTYTKENVEIEEKELANLVENKTCKIVEFKEEASEVPKKLNMTILEKDFNDVYQKVFAKGVASREEEVAALNTQITELKAQVEELNAKVTELTPKAE